MSDSLCILNSNAIVCRRYPPSDGRLTLMNREDCGSPIRHSNPLITFPCCQPITSCQQLLKHSLPVLVRIPLLLDGHVSLLLSVVTVLAWWRTCWWLIDRLSRTMVCIHGLLQLNAGLLASIETLVATTVRWRLVVLLLRVGRLIVVVVVVTLVASVLGWRVARCKPSGAGEGLTASLSAATRVQARAAEEDEEGDDDDDGEQNPAAIGIPGRVSAVAEAIVCVAGVAAIIIAVEETLCEVRAICGTPRKNGHS